MSSLIGFGPCKFLASETSAASALVLRSTRMICAAFLTMLQLRVFQAVY
uniref:Uncharacterized protein n=1 Tax=Aegilops tauschii subsp. strangulata TaxID=200361 RepID=A0A453BMX1_AEGTS